MKTAIISILETISPESPNSYLIMPMILKQFYRDKAKLEKKWDEDIYCSLESLREIASHNQHYIEEAFILLFENRYFREEHTDNNKFLETISRINELQDIFDKDDECFKQIYRNIYASNNKITNKGVDWWIKHIYDKIDHSADYFAGNLDYKTAQLCAKVLLKIAAIAPNNISLDKILEACFVRAINFGNIRDFNSAFRFYDIAIEKAKQAGDNTYLFIALQRKLSICIGLSQLDSQTNFDIDRIMCVQAINDMLSDGITSAEDLGLNLLRDEENKKKKAPYREKEYFQIRINKLKEAMPMLPLLLALAKGDRTTSKKYIEQLRESEKQYFGGGTGFSSAEVFENIYYTLFNSPEREEYEGTSQNNGLFIDEETGQSPCFSDDMTLWQKFNLTITEIRSFILQGMFISAGNFCNYLVQLAKESQSDYHMAMAINACAQTFEAQRKNTRALETYKKAISILENADPKTSDADLSPYLYYSILSEIGQIEKDSVPEMAIKTFTKADNWLEKHNMSQMLFKYYILNGRADAYNNLGASELADSDRADFLKFASDETRKRIVLLDSDSREIFWHDTRRLIERTISHITPKSSIKFKNEAYNSVILAKGILLNSETSIKNISSARPETKQIYDELEQNEMRRKHWGQTDTHSIEEYTENYLKSMRLVAEIEKELYGGNGFLNISVNDILNSLEKNEVLVDYFDYEIDNGDRQYISFILQNGKVSPEITELCRESELNSFFEAQLQYNAEWKEVDFSVIYEPFFQESHRLQNLIWTPIEMSSSINPENQVFFIPSGSLHKVVLESLPYGETWSQTLSDRYKKLSRLSHAKNKIQKSDIKSDRTISIFACPNFGEEIQEKSGIKGYTVQMSAGVHELSPWESLPLTKVEAEELSVLFKMAGWTSSIFLQAEATTDNFLKMDGNSPRVLHISTHGFAETVSSAINLPVLKNAFNPLDLTGLILTDGNEGWMYGSKESHKGVLLATEIAQMNLSKTDLVFVSCCFSGEGVIKPDGIYGIQRALKKAGAKTIVMSLWAENEFTGKLFAKEFYRSYLSCQDKDEAFKSARLMVREQVRNPYLWAGFIMLD